MSIIVTVGEGDYTPAPEGIHHAVCVDVVDKGVVETAFGPKHKIRIVWELATLMEDGQHYIIGKQYTASLHEKSSLHKDLKSWRGQAFTAAELRGFDVEKVIGAPCQVLVQQEAGQDGKVWANVTTLLRADPKNIHKASGNYVRAKDRTPQQPVPIRAPQAARRPMAAAAPVNGDDGGSEVIPF